MSHDPTAVRNILRERARALARKADAPANAFGPSIEVLEFKLANESYALETKYVVEACPFKELTPLPCTPPFIRGIVNIRGRILPVLDIKVFFDLPLKGITDLHRIVLVEGNDLTFGLLADQVASVRTIPADAVHPALPTLTGIRAEYLLGVTAEHLIVLDMGRILADPKIIVHEEVEG